jgi:excinuclease ABC subunit B
MASRAAGSRAAGSKTAGQHAAELAGMPKTELALLIQQLQDQMHSAAAELQFELAARLRDEVNELKKELRAMDAAGVRA